VLRAVLVSVAAVLTVAVVRKQAELRLAGCLHRHVVSQDKVDMAVVPTEGAAGVAVEPVVASSVVKVATAGTVAELQLVQVVRAVQAMWRLMRRTLSQILTQVCRAAQEETVQPEAMARSPLHSTQEPSLRL
jgi:hypothetical protein